MDPLSIAASYAGLLGTALKLGTEITQFVIRHREFKDDLAAPARQSETYGSLNASGGGLDLVFDQQEQSLLVEVLTMFDLVLFRDLSPHQEQWVFDVVRRAKERFQPPFPGCRTNVRAISLQRAATRFQNGLGGGWPGLEAGDEACDQMLQRLRMEHHDWKGYQKRTDFVRDLEPWMVEENQAVVAREALHL
ncbi:hypothetical protein OQA88_10562 [Cercophora sp. LCS_1]